jgi:Phytanoyl-CoA dioxygenase (PhyH)
MSIRSRARIMRAIEREAWSFAKGYRELRRSNTTPTESYYSLRKLYCLTNGRFNDTASWVLSRFHPPTELPQADSILGDISDASVARIVRDIEANGFHVFDGKLPVETVNSLCGFAQTIPCQAIVVSNERKLGDYAGVMAPYPRHPVQSPRYDMAQADILENNTVQQLLMDSGLHRVAQEFLRCAPILDLAAMWWSRPFRGIASSEAAQLYHFDMDRIKFIKFFFYLTDVTPESGPHCYVRGSSKRKPAAILRDGRISDEEIRRHYPPEELVEICGERGSIIAVDTRGWHKGKALADGERLLLQLEFTNSMFGQNYSKTDLSKEVSPSFREFVRLNPRMFQGVIRQFPYEHS